MAHVLVVDDHYESVDALVVHLRRRGHRVDCFPDGQEALGTLVSLSDRPDAVLLDLHMPQMDGVTFLQIVRSYLKWDAMPIYLVTALPSGSPEVERAMNYRPAGVFFKSAMHIQDVSAAIEGGGNRQESQRANGPS